MTQNLSLTVVCGLPGVGKTTVAHTLADHLGGTVLRTDVVRKQRFPEPEYTRAEEVAVYDTLLKRAETRLTSGTSIVLDGTFHDRHYRDRADRVANRVGVPCRFVRVICESTVVRERIAARNDDESDATFEIHKQFKEQFETLDRAHLVVDNSGTEAETHEQIREIISAETSLE